MLQSKATKITLVGLGDVPIPMDYLIAMLEMGTEKGLSPQTILHDTGVPMSALLQPELKVGNRSLGRVVLNLIHSLDDPLLPIEYGHRLSFSRHGVLGMAAQSSSTLEEAAQFIARYIKTRAGHEDELKFSIQGDFGCFTAVPPEMSDPLESQRFHMLSLLVSMERLARVLMGVTEEAVESEIRLAYPYPYTIPDTLLSPGLKIIPDQLANELRIPLTLMQRPIPQASPDLFAAAREACEAELHRLGAASGTIESVRQFLRECSGRTPTIEQVAEHLNTSSRTLKRKLQEAGTSYQFIKDSERFRRAITLLQETPDSLEIIAENLGYSDASNFTKAFKNWAGMSPGEYRNRLHSSP